MSDCVFCGQPIGANGSMRLYYAQDSGAEGYACARCERLFQGWDANTPSAPEADPSPPALRHPRLAANPPPLAPSGERRTLSAPAPRSRKDLPAPVDLPGCGARARQGAISRLLDSPPPKPDTSPHSFWILGMKTFAWLLFIATVAGICLWGSQAAFLRDYFPGAAVFLAVLVLVALLAGFLVTGLLMVFLNLAQDVRLIRIRLMEGEEERR
ncbi:MAG: hypothetical protein VB099_04115 [Candidatus Limiplasma sp.]|nr:hypothetical protein [Candidatus Limiplasma sp.]